MKELVYMSNNGQEIAEFVASASISVAIKDALIKWLESDNGDSLHDVLAQLGVSDGTGMMILAAAAGYGGKLGLRTAIKIYRNPTSRARAVRISKTAGRILKAAFVDNRGPTGVIFQYPGE